MGACQVTLEFHDANTDTDTDILARILTDVSDTRFDFLKLFLWHVERHADILATIDTRMSVSASWNASLKLRDCSYACVAPERMHARR